MASQRSGFVKKIFEWTVGVCSVIAILVVLSPLFMVDRGSRRTQELSMLLVNATLDGKEFKESEAPSTVVFFDSAPTSPGRYVLFAELDSQAAVANNWRLAGKKP